MRKSILLALSGCAAALASCNGRPGSSTARDWLESYLSTRSRTQFRIEDFSVTSSEETVLGGVPSYRLSYTANVVFPLGNQPDCLIRLCMVTEGNTFLLPNSTVHYSGEVIFQQATSRWVVAPEWARAPSVGRVELGSDLQCGQIADVIKTAMRSESGGAVQLPTITNPQEISRSESELQCRMQGEANGRSGTLLARAYETESGVRLTISRDQYSGAPVSPPNANQAVPDGSPQSASAATATVRERERIEGESHTVAHVPQEPSRTPWVAIPAGFEPLTRPGLYASPSILNMYCSEDRRRERLSTQSRRCNGGWVRFSIPTASDLPPDFTFDVIYRLHQVD